MGRLIDLIEASGARLSTVATAVGVRPDFIERVDEGRQHLPINVAAGIARAIGVAVPEIVNAVSLISNIVGDRAAVNPFPPIAGEAIRIAPLGQTQDVVVPTPVPPPPPPQPQIWLGSTSGTGVFWFIPSFDRTAGDEFIRSGDDGDQYQASAQGMAVDFTGLRTGVVGAIAGSSVGNRQNEWVHLAIPQKRVMRVPAGIHVGATTTNNLPWYMAFDDLGYLWVGFANETAPNALVRIDPNNSLDTSAVGVAFGVDWVREVLWVQEHRSIYAMDVLNNLLYRIDPDTQLLTAFSVGSINNHGMLAYDPIEDRLVQSPGSAEDIRFYDPITLAQTIVATPGSSTGHRGVAVDTKRHKIWSTDHFGQRLVKFNGETGALETTVALGSRPDGAIIYEPLVENFDDSGNNTGDKIWCTTQNNTVRVIDLDTDTEEASISRNNISISSANRIVYSPYAPPPDVPILGGGAPVVTPGDADIYYSDNALAGHWKAGDHNVISGGFYDRLVDLSGNGRDLVPVGGASGRAAHIASDPTFNGEPSMVFDGVASHYDSTGEGWGWSDMITHVNDGAPQMDGTEFAWMAVFEVTSRPNSPTSNAQPWYPGAQHFMCGGLDFTNDPNGVGVVMFYNRITSTPWRLGGFYSAGTGDGSGSRTDDGPVSASTYPTGMRAMWFAMPADIARIRTISLSDTSATVANSGSTAGANPLPDLAGPFNIGRIATSTHPAHMKLAELWCWKRFLEVELIQSSNGWRQQYINARYGALI